MTNPLVSIPVITYNSSKTILETLESIKAQTYQNIELIVSDDGSKDDTVAICEKWIAQNKERFVRAEVITVAKNTGVSANGNRAEGACVGEWIKLIAGDDILMPTCIADYVAYVEQHPETVYMFSRIEAFGASEERNRYFTEHAFDYSFFDLDASRQYEKLIWQNCVTTCTCMFNRSKNDKLGLRNDERIPMLEDWPRWINVTKKGVQLRFLDKVEVKYRIHEQSLSTTSTISPTYRHSNMLLCKYYQIPYTWHLGLHQRAVLYYLKLQTMMHPNSRWRKKLFEVCDKLYNAHSKNPVEYSMIEIDKK